MKNINHNGKSTKIAYYPCSTAARRINANISINHKDKSTKKRKTNATINLVQ
ncbi:hypothetical protein NC652_015870 [Populus alba x Populus x berolinensis]|nr:hypothetical protein NC652_015870 [Populus alba x Populus x berolinensis]